MRGIRNEGALSLEHDAKRKTRSRGAVEPHRYLWMTESNGYVNMRFMRGP
jgi:hypothetical protein